MTIRITFDIPTDDAPHVVVEWLAKTISESPIACPYQLFNVRVRASEVNPMSEYERRSMI